MLIYHKEYEDFLVRLRDVGVVHVQLGKDAVADTPEQQKLLSEYNRYQRLVKRLEMLAPENKEIAKSGSGAAEVAERVEGQLSTLEHISVELQSTVKEAATMNMWGEFDLSLLGKLKEAGYTIRFYQTSVKSMNPQWMDRYNAIVVNNKSSRIYFVTVTPNDDVPEIDAEEIKFSDMSLSQLVAEKERLKVEEKLLGEQLASSAMQNLPLLRAALVEMQHKMEFSRIASGGEKVTDDKLVLLEGWIPDDCVGKVKESLDADCVIYELRRARRGDNPPVKLKNNAFTGMYETLTKMYGMPSATDFDPTPIVAPFFSLFFAFCMGDAGYGLILILLGFLLRQKLGKDMRGMMNLVITLGIFTTVIGAFLGTFFGISLINSDIPEKIKSFILAGNVEIMGSTYDKQMILALAIGVVHISLAMTVKAINSTFFYGFKESLSAWGWWLVVVGGVIVGALSFMSVIPEEVSKWAFIAVGGIGALGIYVFNNLKRNVFINIGAGLWDTYNMASGLLGDVLSYIRLFALGLAGGMLGQTFNNLALMVVEGKEGAWAILGWIGFGLIIIFGHTLNIAMSCLSAFVHPLRLTFVEYFKNAGYSGKGVEYKPFKNK